MTIVSEERVKNLVKILNNYSGILDEFEIKDQIIRTIKFEKPLTSIEIESEDTDIVF